MKRYTKFRKGHVGNWVLLGKIYTKHANCYDCGKELHGEQLIYTHLMTKEKIAVCQLCVRKFESMNSNPINQKLLDEYNKEEKRAKKVYIKVFRETGSHKEAFNAENKIITDAQNRYEKIKNNPVNLYQDFHGNPPVKKVKVYYEAPDGEEIVKIGRLVRIDYTPEANSRYEGTHFTHESGDLGHKTIKSNAILATNKSGTQLYIVKEKKGKYPKFSGRGILG